MTAATVDVLRREVKVLAFDLYGTIVDMQQGLIDAATPFLRDKGWDGDPRRFVTWWRRTHYEDSMIDALCDRGHTPYRQVAHRAVSHVMTRSGISHTQEEVQRLVGHIEKLRPFPDVVEPLARLRTRYRLVILSNGDPDMLENARPSIGFDFDMMISAAEAGSFKPHYRTYQKAQERVGEERTSIMLVASHAFDCIGAKSWGMRTAFIDRRGRPYGETPHQPDLIVPSIAALADALA